MSMLKLLSNGQSVMGIGSKANTYKMPAKATLPKFAPMGRPITLAPAVVEQKLPIQPSLFDAPRAAVAVPAPVIAPVKIPTLALKEAGPSPWQKMGAVGKAFVRQVFLGHKPRPTPAATVQAELALEKVTPMRNDLSDADLEVVSAKVGNAQGGSIRRGGAEAAGEAWTKITTRFSRRNNNTAQPVSVPATEVSPAAAELTTH